MKGISEKKIETDCEKLQDLNRRLEQAIEEIKNVKRGKFNEWCKTNYRYHAYKRKQLNTALDSYDNVLKILKKHQLIGEDGG